MNAYFRIRFTLVFLLGLGVAQGQINSPLLAAAHRRNAGGFTPPNISGLLLWLYGDTIGGSSGSAVSTWSDSSGNANSATQATSGQQPVKIDSVVNGHTIVRFDGSQQSLVLATAYSSTTNTIFAVFKETATRFIALGQGNSATPNGTFFGSAYAINFLLWRNDSDAGLTLADTNPSAFVVLAGVNSSGSAEMWRDGISKGTGTVSATLNYSTIGTRSVDAQRSTGDIAELIVYNSALSTGDRQTVEDYLGTKYGITITH